MMWERMKNVSKVVCLLAAFLTPSLYHSAAQAASLLPNAEQTFVDQNGKPLASGCVYFYVPGTSTPKDTFANPEGTTTNTNPVVLDLAGRAIIYGVGTYRQVVVKAPCLPSGEQVWDQLTADPSSSITIFAGASSGTPNAVTVNAPSFTGQDGQIINYISTYTNSGGVTFNPSDFGNVPVVRDGATGPSPLTGGELVATNAVSLMYDATAGVFHIMSPITWPNTSGVPVGTIIPVSTFIAPTNFAFAYGQAVSRTLYPVLLAAMTSVQTGSISSGNPTITGLADTTQFGYGTPVEALGIPTGAKVISCTSSSCTMDQNASTTRSGNMTFFSAGAGDGSTTFNLPDYRGVTLIGRDNMGGTAANVSQISTTISTTSASTSATVASATGLSIGMTVASANIVGGTTVTAISGTTITLSIAASGTAVGTAARFSLIRDAQGLGRTGGATTHTPVISEMAAHNHAVFLNDPGHSHSLASSATLGAGSNGQTVNGPGPIVTSTSTTGITIRDASGGGGTPNQTATTGAGNAFGILNPVRTVNYAVRLTP